MRAYRDVIRPLQRIDEITDGTHSCIAEPSITIICESQEDQETLHEFLLKHTSIIDGRTDDAIDGVLFGG